MQIFNREFLDYCELHSISDYNWQTHISNPRFAPTFTSIIEELKENDFSKMTKSESNDTIRRCKEFLSHWNGKSIRTLCSGEDEMYGSWIKGQQMSIKELFSIKSYTDFTNLQKELSKCFWQSQNTDRFYHQQRLMQFYHWRTLLTYTIKKFGEPLGNRIIFHGVDQFKKLNIDSCYALHGPFSTSLSFQIAHSYASSKGFIIEMCSKYPRMGICYFFDARKVSNFPNEQELLIGFMYTRILKIHSGMYFSSINYTSNIVLKYSYFVLNWMLNGIFSFSPALEIIAQSIFYSTYDCFSINNEQNEEKRTVLREIYDKKMIPECVISAFKEYMIDGIHSCDKNRKQTFHLDCISDGLKQFFYDINEECTLQCYRFSFRKLAILMPNITHLNLYEMKEYEINEHFCTTLIENCCGKLLSLKEIIVHKYQACGKSESPLQLSGENIRLMDKFQWRITSQMSNGKHGYRYSVKKIESGMNCKCCSFRSDIPPILEN